MSAPGIKKWYAQIITTVLLTSLLASCVGTAVSEPKAQVSTARGAFVIEMGFSNLPFPATSRNDGKGASYVLEIAYIQDASAGEAQRALDLNWGNQEMPIALLV